MKRIKIEMLKDEKGADTSSRGFSLPVKKYKKGEHHEISEGLFRDFKSLKACKELKDKDFKPEAEEIEVEAPKGDEDPKGEGNEAPKGDEKKGLLGKFLG